MATIDKERILQFRGQDLCDNDGSKLGSIEEIYLDTETGEPEWALVHTGLFGRKQTFVPIRDATEGDGALRVHRRGVLHLCLVERDPDGRLTQSEEADLYRHFGMTYADGESGAGSGEQRDGAMKRYEAGERPDA